MMECGISYFQLLEVPIQGPNFLCGFDNLREQRNEFSCITLHDPCNYHTSFCICSFSAIRPTILSSRRDILAVSALALIYQKKSFGSLHVRRKKGGARSKSRSTLSPFASNCARRDDASRDPDSL